MNLGKAIKICRIQKNMRQSELAQLSGISVAYLSLLEQGKRDPNFSVLEKIAKAMNIPLSIIIFLATDHNDLKDFSPELIEKLSYTALSLIKAENDAESRLSSTTD